MNSLVRSFSLDIIGILEGTGLVTQFQSQRNINENDSENVFQVPDRKRVQVKACRPENVEDEFDNGGASKSVCCDPVSNSSLGNTICSVLNLPSQVCSSYNTKFLHFCSRQLSYNLTA